jgi:hypothetical protein
MKSMTLDEMNELLKKADVDIETFIDENEGELAELLKTGSVVVTVEGRDIRLCINKDAVEILENLVTDEVTYETIVQDYSGFFCELIETGSATFELDLEPDPETSSNNECEEVLLVDITLEVTDAD